MESTPAVNTLFTLNAPILMTHADVAAAQLCLRGLFFFFFSFRGLCCIFPDDGDDRHRKAKCHISVSVNHNWVGLETNSMFVGKKQINAATPSLLMSQTNHTQFHAKSSGPMLEIRD